MKRFSRVMAFLLTAAVIFSSFPAVIFAETETAETTEAVEEVETETEALSEEEEGLPVVEADFIVEAEELPLEDDGTLSDDEEFEYFFNDWNDGAPALSVLVDYIEDITDPDSPDYIPAESRIAVFDMDGTLYGELFPTYLEYYALAWRILKDPSISPDAEMLEVGRTLRDCALDNSFPSDMPVQHAIQAARAYSGMTLNEFSDYITEILLRDVDGFEGMCYGEAFYHPMIEVVEYLQENDFTVYVVSGSDRFLCRTLLEGIIDVPYANIIGMDDAVVATGQEGTDGLDYVFSAEDTVIRTDKLLIKNLKMNKVAQIVRDIGQQPVLSFGNSSGDCSMHNYTMYHNPYRSLAFMLVADDDERDYAKPEKAAELRTKWEEAGYQVISMKNDFRTFYGDDVKKTGSFHWMEELAEDREPAEKLTSKALEGRAVSAEIAEPADAVNTQQ